MYEQILTTDISNKYAELKAYLCSDKNKENLGMIYKTIGEVYREAGDANKGIQASLKALTMFNKNEEENQNADPEE